MIDLGQSFDHIPALLREVRDQIHKVSPGMSKAVGQKGLKLFGHIATRGITHLDRWAQTRGPLLEQFGQILPGMAEPSAEQKPKATKPAEKTAKPESKESKPQTKEAPPAPKPAPPVETAESKESGRGWTVQVNAFPDEKSAKTWVDRLKNKGYKAYVAEANAKGKIWYRVRVGQYGTREEAKKVEEALKTKENYTKAFIANR